MDVWEYGEAAEPTRFPWPPPRDGSLLAAFGQTWKSATFDPGAFFRRLPPRKSMGPAVLYYLVLGILISGASLFWDVTGLFTSAAGEDVVAGELGFGALNPVVSFLLSPLLLLVALFMSAGISHLLLVVFGGAAAGFGTTVRVFSYAYSPMIFGVVPILGTVVGTIWMLVLAVIGLQKAHGTDGWKAALAVILPFVLIVALFAFSLMLLIAAGAIILGS